MGDDQDRNDAEEYRRQQARELLHQQGYRETYPGSGQYVPISDETLNHIERSSNQAEKKPEQN